MTGISIDGFVKQKVQAVQDFTLLFANAFANVFSSPRYIADTIVQMDVIGVGSLPIVLLVGFFSGGVVALQTYRTLSTFGSVTLLGQVVSLSVVREMGPVLTALVTAGRNSSGIASEIGSMLVSEQVDAMRALGTDPVRKLVTPRLIATVVTLPILTILADFSGMLGGFFVSFYTVRLTSVEYWTTAYQALAFEDVAQGLLKPFLFAFIVALVGCYFGLSTRGGTEGVGRSTTQAVVVASVLILVVDFFFTKFLIAVGFF
ncbi:MAG TPA: ABC transporter permease [Terriglobia bacterium]|nr:ABC transporter permease [Terriglobia bacterium]